MRISTHIGSLLLAVISFSCAVERGAGQHWAHPVIADGALLVRHGDVVLAYGIGGAR